MKSGVRKLVGSCHVRCQVRYRYCILHANSHFAYSLGSALISALPWPPLIKRVAQNTQQINTLHQLSPAVSGYPAGTSLYTTYFRVRLCIPLALVSQLSTKQPIQSRVICSEWSETGILSLLRYKMVCYHPIAWCSILRDLKADRM